MKVIADTGLIVAYASRTDLHHRWALEVMQAVTGPMLTCEAVLSESGYHLGSAAYVLSLVEVGMLKVDFDCAANVRELSQLAVRYSDRQPDLADLCLIRMSEIHPHHTVLTIDESDFRVYRRNTREAIPMLCPPKPQR